MTLIAAYDKRVCLHGFSVPIAAQLSAIYTANVSPISEFIMTISPIRQIFFKNPVLPKDGYIHLMALENPGVGLDVDESKVIRSWYHE